MREKLRKKFSRWSRCCPYIRLFIPFPGGDKALHNGNPCFPGQIAAEAGREDMPGTSGRKAAEPAEGVRARMYDSQGVFAGVYEYRKDRGWWKPWKMFLSREEQPEGRQG